MTDLKNDLKSKFARQALDFDLKARLNGNMIKIASERMGVVLKAFDNTNSTQETLDRLRGAVAGVIREYTTTLIMRGLIPEDSPLPITVRGVELEGNKVNVIFNVDPHWIDGLPPEVRQEIGALLSGRPLALKQRPVSNLQAVRLGSVREGVVVALSNGGWVEHKKVIKKAIELRPFAKSDEVLSAIDQLWEDGKVESKSEESPIGHGMVWGPTVTMWRLLP